MKISSKARYGLASMISIAQDSKESEYVTIISISEKLGISKIYLEQVFALLKRAELVISFKGAQGGYKLALPPESISIGKIMRAIEGSMFEKTRPSVTKELAYFDKAMELLVWDTLDRSITSTLDGIMLDQLVNETERNQQGKNNMFYI